jgi:hypothetical protein
MLLLAFIYLQLYTQKSQKHLSHLFFCLLSILTNNPQLLMGSTTFSIRKVLQLISCTWESSTARFRFFPLVTLPFIALLFFRQSLFSQTKIALSEKKWLKWENDHTETWLRPGGQDLDRAMALPQISPDVCIQFCSSCLVPTSSRTPVMVGAGSRSGKGSCRCGMRVRRGSQRWASEQAEVAAGWKADRAAGG